MTMLYRALRYLNEIPFLGIKSNDYENEIKKLDIKKTHLNSELTELEYSINKFRNSFG